MKIISAFIAVTLFLQVNAQEKPVRRALQICESDLQWQDTKPPLVPGAQIAIVDGNPKWEGHFTVRIKFPPYYKLPPHKHAVDERTTIIKGSIRLGFGEVMDSTKTILLTEGCYLMNPAGNVHYSFVGAEETIIQISTNGPWGLELVYKEE